MASSFEFHPQTFVVWPSLVFSASVGICEDCAVGHPEEPEKFGWCITLSWLVFSFNLIVEDRP